MKLYKVTLTDEPADDPERVHYEGTLKGAHAWAKNKVVATRYVDVEIAEVTVGTDKASIVAALNGGPVVVDHGVTWSITRRGGLKQDDPA